MQIDISACILYIFTARNVCLHFIVIVYIMLQVICLAINNLKKMLNNCSFLWQSSLLLTFCGTHTRNAQLEIKQETNSAFSCIFQV